MSEVIERPPGHAEIDRSRIVAASHRDGIRKAVDAWASAYKELATGDIFACARALGKLIEASDAMETAAKEAGAKLTDALHVIMELGATKVEGGSGVFTLAKLPVAVDILDPAAVPAEFMTIPDPPQPKPDKTRIAAHLKAGAAINWAVLQRDRGTHVRYTPRKT